LSGKRLRRTRDRLGTYNSSLRWLQRKEEAVGTTAPRRETAARRMAADAIMGVLGVVLGVAANELIKYLHKEWGTSQDTPSGPDVVIVLHVGTLNSPCTSHCHERLVLTRSFAPRGDFPLTTTACCLARSMGHITGPQFVVRAASTPATT
jgi:hypothetical protein